MSEPFLFADDPKAEWVSVREFAKEIKASPAAVYGWCADGAIPHKRKGAHDNSAILIDKRVAPLIREWRVQHYYIWSHYAQGYWDGLRDGGELLTRGTRRPRA